LALLLILNRNNFVVFIFSWPSWSKFNFQQQLVFYYGATLLISSVITFLQRNYRCMTNNTIFKMAKSVVPPPINQCNTSFFSSWLKTASANGSNVKPDNSIPELWIHLPTFLIDEACPTTTWKLDSNLPHTFLFLWFQTVRQF
jgi:hypothetical protein